LVVGPRPEDARWTRSRRPTRRPPSAHDAGGQAPWPHHDRATAPGRRLFRLEPAHRMRNEERDA
jgi:hypothetical protein